eukprot:scaffold8686_cov91-Skeletonema_dohrnii-CCMP3373.AAC.2
MPGEEKWHTANADHQMVLIKSIFETLEAEGRFPSSLPLQHPTAEGSRRRFIVTAVSKYGLGVGEGGDNYYGRCFINGNPMSKAGGSKRRAQFWRESSSSFNHQPSTQRP